jgi:hypothetical protein
MTPPTKTLSECVKSIRRQLVTREWQAEYLGRHAHGQKEGSPPIGRFHNRFPLNMLEGNLQELSL